MNYDEARETYHVNVPELFNFADDIVDRHASTGDKLALHWVDDEGAAIQRTFSEVSNRSKRLANGMMEAGVQQGDTVVAVLSRELEWWDVMTASIRMGAIISPGTMQLAANDLAYRVNTSGATCIVTNTLGAEKFDQVADQCSSVRTKIIVGGDREGWLNFDQILTTSKEDWSPIDTRAEDPAMCYFTSGTTGYPKMTIHNHGYALAHRSTALFWLDLKPEDLHWNISDTGWAKAAWSSYFSPWLVGAGIFVHHTSGFNPKSVLKLLEEYPITTMCGAPTVYRMLVQNELNGYRFKALRHCVAAGEPLNPEIISIWANAFGIKIRDGYGQTETVLLCGNYPFLDVKPGSMGRAAPGIDLHVINNEGVSVVGEEGDIAVRVSPNRPAGLFAGYKGEPEKTAKCFKGDWYITGDRARVDDDGYFWFVSRADDVILSSGYRIGPFEVESALLEHPAVVESAVVSSPDVERGEVVKAFVVLADGYAADDQTILMLQNHVKSVTAPYKYPRKIEFVDELPKTVSGKIRRVELRESEWASR